MLQYRLFIVKPAIPYFRVLPSPSAAPPGNFTLFLLHYFIPTLGHLAIFGVCFTVHVDTTSCFPGASIWLHRYLNTALTFAVTVQATPNLCSKALCVYLKSHIFDTSLKKPAPILPLSVTFLGHFQVRANERMRNHTHIGCA